MLLIACSLLGAIMRCPGSSELTTVYSLLFMQRDTSEMTRIEPDPHVDKQYSSRQARQAWSNANNKHRE